MVDFPRTSVSNQTTCSQIFPIYPASPLYYIYPQTREGQVGRPLRDGAPDEPRAVGAEAAHRRHGQVAGRGQLGRHPQDGLARRLLRLHAAHLPPLLR